MSELTEIAILLFRNLSDALLTTASQLSGAKPFTQAKPQPEILENPDLESLAVGDFVFIEIIYRKQPKRCAGVITKIIGEEITVTNDVTQKEWIVTAANIVYLQLPSLRNQ